MDKHLNQHNYRQGFTLIELLISLVVILIVVFSIIPTMQYSIDKAIAKKGSEEVRQLLAYARVQAILYQSHSIVCPLTPQGTCGNNWNKPLTAFIDQNSNRIFDGQDEILRVIEAVNESTHRQFNNGMVRFDSKGGAGFNAGSLSYCYKNKYVGGISLIISRIGRIRKGGDKNNDGLPELANGNNITCK